MGELLNGFAGRRQVSAGEMKVQMHLVLRGGFVGDRVGQTIHQGAGAIRNVVGDGFLEHVLLVGEQQGTGILELFLRFGGQKTDLDATIQHIARQCRNAFDDWPQVAVLFARQVMLNIPAQAFKPGAQRAMNVAPVSREQFMGNTRLAQHGGVGVDNDVFIASGVVAGKGARGKY